MTEDQIYYLCEQIQVVKISLKQDRCFNCIKYFNNTKAFRMGPDSKSSYSYSSAKIKSKQTYIKIYEENIN